MSLNSQLSKEIRFIFNLFNEAAWGASMEDGDLPTDTLILAGGAIRDLYFDRPHVRDLDMYFNSSFIDPLEFARNLKRIDVDAAARAAGFSTAAIHRASDVPQPMAVAPWGHLGHLVATSLAVQQVQATSSSGSGSKIDPGGKAHPLQGVEEFVCYVDGDRFNVELMTVSMSPADYVNTHFAVKLSRCYYDGNRVRYTQDFFEDARNKTITVACPVEHARFERLFSYYLPKLKSYFPDFDVRVDLRQMNR